MRGNAAVAGGGPKAEARVGAENGGKGGAVAVGPAGHGLDKRDGAGRIVRTRSEEERRLKAQANRAAAAARAAAAHDAMELNAVKREISQLKKVQPALSPDQELAQLRKAEHDARVAAAGQFKFGAKPAGAPSKFDAIDRPHDRPQSTPAAPSSRYDVRTGRPKTKRAGAGSRYPPAPDRVGLSPSDADIDAKRAAAAARYARQHGLPVLHIERARRR
eukprot:SAG31_NODE_537_length_14325_cov_19.890881_6_plen_218_part_00